MSLVQPSLHELHVQLKMPNRSSRLVVTHLTGSETKSAVKVDIAGSTYNGTRKSKAHPPPTADMARNDVV